MCVCVQSRRFTIVCWYVVAAASIRAFLRAWGVAHQDQIIRCLCVCVFSLFFCCKRKIWSISINPLSIANSCAHRYFGLSNWRKTNTNKIAEEREKETIHIFNFSNRRKFSPKIQCHFAFPFCQTLHHRNCNAIFRGLRVHFDYVLWLWCRRVGLPIINYFFSLLSVLLGCFLFESN